ncbi:hypothetical protein BGZ63DRAFT_449198 [Mariannaea sp. PMI_226]|nr:hypothetical protein BGZ63DRAFT_449198 [Mariannaea sp. PMI_226]
MAELPLPRGQIHRDPLPVWPRRKDAKCCNAAYQTSSDDHDSSSEPYYLDMLYWSDDQQEHSDDRRDLNEQENSEDQDESNDHKPMPLFSKRLRANIQTFFQKRQEFEENVARCPNIPQNLRSHVLSANPWTVTGLQQYSNHAYHIDGRFEPTVVGPQLDKAFGATEMVNLDLLSPIGNRAQRRELELTTMKDHRERGMRYTWAAGRRLQGITETYNMNQYNPIFPSPEQFTGLMTTEDDKNMTRKSSDLSVVASLERATRKYGCYMLELDELEFKCLMAKTKPSDHVPGAYPLSYKNPGGSGNWQADARVKQKVFAETGDSESTFTTSTMRLDARKGSITLRHTNMPDAEGRWATWMWFKITKPLITACSPIPEMKPMPKSCIVIAIPSVRVLKVSEDDGGTNSKKHHFPGPNHRLLMTFRYSQDGIPVFACARKPKVWYEKSIEDRMLCADLGYNYAGSSERFWARVSQKADDDFQKWRCVQEDMARFCSLVKVKSKAGTDWVQVPPEEGSM